MTFLLAGLTVLALLVFLGRISPVAGPRGPEGTVFYMVPYHYGFAFYDSSFREIDTAGDPQIRKKIAEDLELGNVEHIIGISAHPVYVATDVARLLDGGRFRDGAPKSLEEAVRRRDPTINTVTFTAKKVGAFDVICVDSGMEGSATCGWGHKWMVGKGAFVIRK